MKSIRAVFESGAFRPIGPVDLPEGCEVVFEPTVVEVGQPQPTDPQFAHLDPDLAGTYAILGRRYDGGPPDAAARHDGHQP